MAVRVASIATANIAFGATASAYQIALAAIVSRSSSEVTFGAWAVVTAVASLAPLLGSGLSAAVARRLLFVRESLPHDKVHNHEASLMRYAARLSLSMTIIGVVTGCLFAFAFPHFYPELKGSRPGLTVSMVLLSILGACWILPAQSLMGWLIAERKNWNIALAGIVARGSVILLTAIAIFALEIDPLLAVGGCSLALWLGVVVLRRSIGSFAGLHDDVILKGEREAVAPIVRSLGAWNITSAGIQVCMVPIIAALNHNAAAPSFLAFTLVSTLTGLTTAMAGSLLAPIAKLAARGDRKSIFRTVSIANAILWLSQTATGLCIFLLLDWIVTMWVGVPSGPSPAYTIFFAAFALQSGLRVTGLASSIVVAMAGSSKAVLLSTLVEALLFLLLAIPLGVTFGTNAYLTGLVIAGSLGALAVSGMAVCISHLSDITRAQNGSIYSAALLQLASVVIWGSILYHIST